MRECRQRRAKGQNQSAGCREGANQEFAPDEAYRLVRTYDAERMLIVQSGKEKLDLLGKAPETAEFGF